MEKEKLLVEEEPTWITETREIAEPVSAGGFDNLDFGLAKYAAGDADRTFKTCIYDELNTILDCSCLRYTYMIHMFMLCILELR